ncbi:hypothetical protein B0H14DRAFT_3456554 [Mycena olivaceomarginata]|nr:hypothetical protein B0H14DRAFT_3456554 [Mycena olivaceomarginata]
MRHAKTEPTKPDRFEWFNMGQDGLMGNTPLQPLPPLAHAHLPLLTSFLKHGQDVVATISSTLVTQLGLPPDAFTSLQAPTKPSGTVIRLLKAFASPALAALRTSMIHHTDLGHSHVARERARRACKSSRRAAPPRMVATPRGSGGRAGSSGALCIASIMRRACSASKIVQLRALSQAGAGMRPCGGWSARTADTDGEDAGLTAWEWEVEEAPEDASCIVHRARCKPQLREED